MPTLLFTSEPLEFLSMLSYVWGLPYLSCFVECQIMYCRSPPRIPEVHLPEEPFLQVASALRIEINRGFAVLHSIGSGRDLKKFLMVCDFITIYHHYVHIK